MFGELSHGVTRTLFTLDISTREILTTDQFFVVSFIETWNPTKMGEKCKSKFVRSTLQLRHNGYYWQIIFCLVLFSGRGHLFHHIHVYRNAVAFGTHWEVGETRSRILNTENGSSNALNMHETNKNSVGV